MPFFQKNDELTALGDRLIETCLDRYSALAANQIALTWVVYDPPCVVNTGGAIAPTDFWTYPVRGYSYRGVERVYPASLVKLFYAVAVQEWLERGMLTPSEELDRALRDALVDSSNDATSYLVDCLTGTTSGPELPPGPADTWAQQRQIVNRYFQNLGWPELATVNICQKTWGDGPFGRDRRFYGDDYSNRNYLTTDAIARLFHAIAGGVAVSAERSQRLMNWLARSLDPAAVAALDPSYDQITGFLGQGLPPEAKLWSKAGWMSRVRLDCAYIELPDTRPYLLSVAIDSPLGDRDRTLLPWLSAEVAIAMGTL